MSTNIFYTVWIGESPGVYDSWSKCEKNTKGFSGARFKSFSTFDDALSAFNQGLKTENHPPNKKDLESGDYKLPDTDEAIKNGCVVIYTDGSLIQGKLGDEYDRKTDLNIGGYGALLQHEKGDKEIQGTARGTTISIMEMTACIEALKCLRIPSDVILISDSGFIVNTINLGWNKKKNKDLWNQLDSLISIHNISFHWVSGHAGIEGNEIADGLATSASNNLRKSLSEPDDVDIDPLTLSM